MAWEWRQGHRLTYLSLPVWEAAGVEAAFSSRRGGRSTGRFQSLNLGLHVGDKPEHVLGNRERWLAEFEADWTETVVGEQVHGTNVVWVGANEAGRGVQTLITAVPGVDGMLTTSGLGLMAFFADCVPLFFYHPGLKAVGIAHAGWRGTVDNIGLKVLRLLDEAGAKADDCWVAIGPSIGPCCYEVDEHVAREFRSRYAGTDISFLYPTREKHYQLDLRLANRSLLIAGGVKPDHIWTADVCTACSSGEFFSHRREGVPTGRMAGWIRNKNRKEVEPG